MLSLLNKGHIFIGWIINVLTINTNTKIVAPMNSFQGIALWGGSPKEALYCGGHNLVNFSSFVPPPPPEAMIMYWLSSFQLSFGFPRLFSKNWLPPSCQDKLLRLIFLEEYHRQNQCHFGLFTISFFARNRHHIFNLTLNYLPGIWTRLYSFMKTNTKRTFTYEMLICKGVSTIWFTAVCKQLLVWILHKTDLLHQIAHSLYITTVDIVAQSHN